MKVAVVFSQNVILSSMIDSLKSVGLEDCEIYYFTPHLLFKNERNRLSFLSRNSFFFSFSDLLSDSEMEETDRYAYREESSDYALYLKKMREEKNIKIYKKMSSVVNPQRGFIFSAENDLGIYDDLWKAKGFKKLDAEYYYRSAGKPYIRRMLSRIEILKRIYHKYFQKKKNKCKNNEVFVSTYQGKKIVFIGKMHRIAYRLSIDFVVSPEDCENLNNGIYEKKDKCIYLTTWHEHGKCNIPDSDTYSVYWIQDGYLPPNYSHDDYAFKPANVKYYVWDSLGAKLFKNKHLPVEMIPFRKKLYLPIPVFPDVVKNILVVASGSGDWTALKNRSDDDALVVAFVEIAKRYPNISITYRCHPSWTHPKNVGVNSVNRVAEYFESEGLDNIKVSSNIPINNDGRGNYELTFARSSLDEDLQNADLVFGEHSISMVDAGFKSIPFCSVNLTRRRNFFVGMTDLGFPHCTSVDEIAALIENVKESEYKENYLEAIRNYNLMTDEDEI